MAATPVIQGTNNSAIDTNTSHAVSMPASIVAGEKLLAFFVCDGGVTVDTPSGWTKEVDEVETASGGTVVRLVIYSKTAAGSDTLTVTTSGNTDSDHAAYRVVTNNGFEFGTADGGSDANPNPPSLTPSGGSMKYTWIAVAAAAGVGVSSYPTNYTDNQVTNSTESFCIAVATYDYEGTSQDPATYTMDGGSYWVAATVAIEEQDPIQGNFSTLTSSSTVFTPGISFAADASFSLLTGAGTVIAPTATVSTSPKYSNTSKNSETMTAQSKNSATMTAQSKNTATMTAQSKNTATMTAQSKNAESWTAQSKT